MLKEIEIAGMHVEILSPEGTSQRSGTDDHIYGSRNFQSAVQDPLRLVHVLRTSTGNDIQVLPTPTQVASL